MKQKPHKSNRPLLFAVFLALAAGLFVLNSAWDRAPVTNEAAANVEAASSDWTNCSFVRVPLEIGMEVQNVIENQGGADKNGGLVEVLVSVKPLLEARDLSWRLELPQGVKVQSGPSEWTGLVGKEQSASFVMTLSVPDGKEYYVDAVGEYESTAGAKVRKAKSLKLDLGALETPANPSFIRVDETGRSVVTYRGTVIGGDQ